MLNMILNYKSLSDELYILSVNCILCLVNRIFSTTFLEYFTYLFWSWHSSWQYLSLIHYPYLSKYTIQKLIRFFLVFTTGGLPRCVLSPQPILLFLNLYWTHFHVRTAYRIATCLARKDSLLTHMTGSRCSPHV